MPTVPTPADFSQDLQPVIYLPPNSQPTNVIIFLPGLGDTTANFASFAKALNLPDAVTITLQPPYPLPFPFGPGSQWSDDVQVDTSTGTFDPDSPLTKAAAQLADLITTLQSTHKFTPPQIHLFGYGQGGSLALTTLLHPALQDIPSLGGVTSIGGAIPLASSAVTSGSKNRTPVLLLGGRRGALAKDEQSPVKRVRDAFEFVEYHEWRKVDDSMPKNREEALPMMQFLARRLRSRRGVPEGAVEL
ncbi:uncharacterized protein HMPREF1541_10765 [Cyphellophora europaea CBS 101466]|uniref:Phospholipase/carboxylesterase/thioesterase domain-containing protein n=1 Tax=Cyphellophora europaea (strain CBS 101466) TaxID=1220924 RepID=W2S8F0_CYPE1|nr:uncharacterized protein HMPREF1541_10765 [Cyphellophora europaea CBS 101466]ETN44214.1 hypothetical protein HMPREF1541_10765 [Cyphellophora europaea CBS 101466]